jgi:hypothetical protein
MTQRSGGVSSHILIGAEELLESCVWMVASWGATIPARRLSRPADLGIECSGDRMLSERAIGCVRNTHLTLVGPPRTDQVQSLPLRVSFSDRQRCLGRRSAPALRRNARPRARRHCIVTRLRGASSAPQVALRCRQKSFGAAA